MRNYLELGTAPTDEKCVQVTNKQEYLQPMREECKRYINLLKKLFPNKPEGCEYKIKSFPHDFGNYLEVVIYYNPEIEEEIEYAFNVENNLPNKWEV